MPASSAPKRQRGRPRKDNKQFNIRMSQETHAALLSAARADGYDSLGDWLAIVAIETKESKPPPKTAIAGLSGPRLTFLRRVRKATTFLNSLFESFDRDTRIATTAEIQHSLTLLDQSHRRLFASLRRESVPV